MRLSARRDDPDFRPESLVAKVLLDGVEIKHVVVADEDKGEVEVLSRDEDGEFIVNRFHNRVVTEIRRGKVEIVIPPSGDAP